jgi:serpin B
MNAVRTPRPDFAIRLYGEVAEADARSNLFLSPFSVQTALAMCAAGAHGETRKVLADLIGAPPDVAEQNRHYAALLKTLDSAGGNDVQLSVANGLWGQHGYRFRPEYLNDVAAFYDGALSEVDFRSAPDAAVKTINAWVLAKTAGKIKDLIQRGLITPDTRLILTNAIYFKGKWDQEFDPSHTRDDDWHGPSGVVKTPLMHRTGGYLYCQTGDFQALDLPYRGGKLSMLVVLPRKQDGLAALERAWTAGRVFEQVTKLLAYEETVNVALPRFKIETEFMLSSALCAMGARLAFSDAADFTGIGAEPLKISEVVHKAFVEVNEEGTEAAAATGVAMLKLAMPIKPKTFRADHPLLFAIRDRKTNALFFCGRLVQPQPV